ncbi:hypothetical protein FIBSPDRAFT_875345, partial [Athelia psychrophila]
MSENVKVSSSLIDNTDSGAGGPFFAATQICHLAPKFQILGLLHPEIAAGRVQKPDSDHEHRGAPAWSMALWLPSITP